MDYTIWIFLGAMLLLLGGMWFFNNRRYKKQQQEREEKMNALSVGDKVLTIGMWIGEIVEKHEDGTYLLKTGNGEFSGYVTIQEGAIYQIIKKDDVFEEVSAPETADVENDSEPAAEDASEDKTDLV